MMHEYTNGGQLYSWIRDRIRGRQAKSREGPLQQPQQILHAQFRIAENFAQQAAPHILPGMNRNCYHTPIWVMPADMAAALARDLKPGFCNALMSAPPRTTDFQRTLFGA